MVPSQGGVYTSPGRATKEGKRRVNVNHCETKVSIGREEGRPQNGLARNVGCSSVGEGRAGKVCSRCRGRRRLLRWVSGQLRERSVREMSSHLMLQRSSPLALCCDVPALLTLMHAVGIVGPATADRAGTNELRASRSVARGHGPRPRPRSHRWEAEPAGLFA